VPGRFSLEQVRSHDFYKLYQEPSNLGIIVGKHSIPIDYDILNEVVQLGFSKDFTEECLKANKHNSETTAYYLLLKKKF